jgi:hypothetical protein
MAQEGELPPDISLQSVSNGMCAAQSGRIAEAIECVGFDATRYTSDEGFRTRLPRLVETCRDFGYDIASAELSGIRVSGVQGVSIYTVNYQIDDVVTLSMPYDGSLRELFELVGANIQQDSFDVEPDLEASHTLVMSYNAIFDQLPSLTVAYTQASCRVTFVEDEFGRHLTVYLSEALTGETFARSSDQVAACAGYAVFSVLGLEFYHDSSAAPEAVPEWRNINSNSQIIFNGSHFGFPITPSAECLLGFMPLLHITGDVTLAEYYARIEVLLDILGDGSRN